MINVYELLKKGCRKSYYLCLMVQFVSLCFLTQSCGTGCTICDLKPCLPCPCFCGSGRRPEVVVTQKDMILDYNEAWEQDQREWKEKSEFFDEENAVIDCQANLLYFEDEDGNVEEICCDEDEVESGNIPPEALNLYQPLVQDYRVSIGDILEVSVLGDEDLLTESVTVAPDGRIYYMFLEGLIAEGKKVEDLQKEIEDKMTSLFLAPTVTVIPEFMSGNAFTILGRVRQPGLYPLEQTISLREAIGRAGGLITDLEIFNSGYLGGVNAGYVQRYTGRNQSISNLKNSFLIRNGKRLEIDFEQLVSSADPSHNIMMFPGDYIYIAPNEDRDVYILGGLGTIPQALPFREEMTLMKALSFAGGFHLGGPYGADLHHVLVIRGELECPSLICVDLWKVLRGGARDVFLQPGDIIYVYDKKFRFGRELVYNALTAFIFAFVNDAGQYYGSKIFH